MLRVLTLSTLFPDAARPAFGRFVERQTQALAARPDVAVRVVAPVGISALLGQLPRYRALAALPDRETRGGLEVLRPRFATLPGPLRRFTPRLLARALAPRLARMRQDFPFDVIDAEFFWPDGPAAVALGRRFGIPVSIKARGSDIHYWGFRRDTRSAVLRAGGAADGLLAVSAALAGDMAGLGLPRPTVHHGGVDLDRFVLADRAAAKAALGIAGPLLVTIGHLNGLKGQAIAIETLQSLPGATLLIVGEGPERPALERQIAALGLGDRARLLGARPHDELPRLLAAADAMVLPTAREGLANVWIEALACGTPVVTTDVGGAREVIDRPEAGRLIARDADAVAAAVRAVLADPPPQAAVREAALRFTWPRNAEALEQHLRALVARHRSL